MEEHKIFKKFINILTQFVDNPSILESVKYDMDLSENLNIDSYNVVEIVLEVENEFNISIEDSLIPQMKTVGDCVKIIRESLKLKILSHNNE